MKRSEMIEIIAKKLDSDLILYTGHYVNTEGIAMRLLTLLEESGMEPPPFQEAYGTGFDDGYGMEETRVEWRQGWEAE